MREALARSDRDFLLSDKVEETPSRYIGALRLFLQHPVEVAGLAVMAGLAGAILVNALALQSGSHTSSFLATQRAALDAVAPVVPAISPAAAASDQAAREATTVLRDVQLALAERGLYDGLADGVLGPKTTAAIKSFQQHNGLPVDGLSTPALLDKITADLAPVTANLPPVAPAPPVDQIAALINAGNPSAAATTTQGSQSDKRLLAIQKALAKQGYGPLKVDGLMSADTRKAIARFEKAYGLPATGEVSARLLQALARSGAKVE